MRGEIGRRPSLAERGSIGTELVQSGGDGRTFVPYKTHEGSLAPITRVAITRPVKE
ncbi:hypothetical protein Psi02_01520 [Planotetraspora silvatica]|uniref:Uncharacterized protein n=1 Tax=Planotetraspora silvatica TaxID=234614 RepID=A0A8J3XPA7_9ACTN|nr:hypothetical protein Psi02_01520 [Planotetraspora silvatica]